MGVARSEKGVEVNRGVGVEIVVFGNIKLTCATL